MNKDQWAKALEIYDAGHKELLAEAILFSLHEHSNMIRAWIDGATLEVSGAEGDWREVTVTGPLFRPGTHYRIKAAGVSKITVPSAEADRNSGQDLCGIVKDLLDLGYKVGRHGKWWVECVGGEYAFMTGKGYKEPHNHALHGQLKLEAWK